MSEQRISDEKIHRAVDLAVLGGLPVAMLATFILGFVLRFKLIPTLVLLDVYVSSFAAFVMGLTNLTVMMLIPSLTLSWCLWGPADRSKRLWVALVFFHLWLAHFMATMIYVFGWVFLPASNSVGSF